MPLAKPPLKPRLKFLTTDPLALGSVGLLPILGINFQQLPQHRLQCFFFLKRYIPKRLIPLGAIGFAEPLHFPAEEAQTQTSVPEERADQEIASELREANAKLENLFWWLVAGG